MSVKKVTRKQAERVLADICAVHSSYIDELGYPKPTLYDYEHEDQQPGEWSIAWEEGPYEWTLGYTLSMHERDHYFTGVFIEPRNHWSLGLYPD